MERIVFVGNNNVQRCIEIHSKYCTLTWADKRPKTILRRWQRNKTEWGTNCSSWQAGWLDFVAWGLTLYAQHGIKKIDEGENCRSRGDIHIFLRTPQVHHHHYHHHFLSQHFPSYEGLLTLTPWWHISLFPFLSVLCILLVQTNLSAFLLHHIFPCNLWSSFSSYSIHYQIPRSFHRFIIFLPQHMTHPSQINSLYHSPTVSPKPNLSMSFPTKP